MQSPCICKITPIYFVQPHIKPSCFQAGKRTPVLFGTGASIPFGQSFAVIISTGSDKKPPYDAAWDKLYLYIPENDTWRQMHFRPAARRYWFTAFPVKREAFENLGFTTTESPPNNTTTMDNGETGANRTQNNLALVLN